MDNDDYQLISALNDLLFCERRCAMHRVEQVWVENRFTLEGTAGHKKVHAGPSEEDLGAQGRVVRGLWLRSDRLRLVGIADLVEFRAARGSEGSGRPEDALPHASGSDNPRLGSGADQELQIADCQEEGESNPKSKIENRKSKIETPYPVEYKRGKRRRWDNDDVQLCAQALALEEMLGAPVPAGAIFHVKSRRRREIVFDSDLRSRTEAAARRLHELFASGETPSPVLKPRCRGCSVRELCLPEMLGERSRARGYQRALFAVGDEG